MIRKEPLVSRFMPRHLFVFSHPAGRAFVKPSWGLAKWGLQAIAWVFDGDVRKKCRCAAARSPYQGLPMPLCFGLGAGLMPGLRGV